MRYKLVMRDLALKMCTDEPRGCWTAALLACASLAICPACGGSSASPTPDAPGMVPDASLCGNGRIDPGEDCDTTPGCSSGCLVTPPAGAAVIRFRGHVNGITDVRGVFDDGLLDAEVWGRIVYSLNTVDTFPDPSVGDFSYSVSPQSPFGTWVTFGDWQFSPGTGTVVFYTYNDAVLGTKLLDEIFVAEPSPTIQRALPAPSFVTFTLEDSSLHALSTDALPSQTLPGRFAWHRAIIDVHGGGMTAQWEIISDLEELTFTRP
jgi:hypothetical protein